MCAIDLCVYIILQKDDDDDEGSRYAREMGKCGQAEATRKVYLRRTHTMVMAEVMAQVRNGADKKQDVQEVK